MIFRTEVTLEESKHKIQLEDRIFSIGSCFATEMASIFASGQMQVFHNPFGVIFHPVAINNALKRIHTGKYYSAEDLIYYKNRYISLDHHTHFDSRYLHKSLELINENITQSIDFLRETRWVIVTYGTSWIYEFIESQKIVANCHKIPQHFFKKRMLTHEEIKKAILETISIIQDIAPKGVRILFTLSPVRHIKDGLVENQRSKAKLLSALHEIIEESNNSEYLPVYEMLMDDLRDYRFYKEDLIHPNTQAVQYVWERFSTAYLSPETQKFIQENNKIQKALSHRPFDEYSEEYQKFKEKTKQKIEQQQKKVRRTIFSEALQKL